MEVVEDETPHVLNKLKDVVMEEVERVQAQGANEYDDRWRITLLLIQRSWARDEALKYP